MNGSRRNRRDDESFGIEEVDSEQDEFDIPCFQDCVEKAEFRENERKEHAKLCRVVLKGI